MSISVSGGGGGGGAAPPPDTGPKPLYPAAPAVTTGTVPFPYGGAGTIEMSTFPTGRPVLALGMDGDAVPRMMYGADSAMGIAWGNGTQDPWAAGAPAGVIDFSGTPPRLAIWGRNGVTIDITGLRVVNSNLAVTKPGAAISLASPDGTGHAVSVNNTGALTIDGAAVGGGGGSAGFVSSYKWGVGD